MIIDNFFGFNLPNFNIPCTKKSAAYLNNVQCGDIFNRVTNIALSRFKWVNLPESCRPEILEITLYFYGTALFMYDPMLGYIHTPCELPGPFNIYYESIKREARSYNYHKEYTINDSVLIKANHTEYADYLTTWNYAPKIANCLRAIDVHTETLKRPFLIKCAEKEKQSVKRAINGILDNEVALVGQRLGEQVPIEVISLSQNSHLTDMWANCKNYLNQCFSSLGVKNSYSEKRERMITTEAEGEGNAIRHTLESELYERKLACEKINKMFGLNVDVEANELEVFLDELMEAEAARVSGYYSQQEQTNEGGEE